VGAKPFVELDRRQPSGKTERAFRRLRLERHLNPTHHAEVTGKSGTSITPRRSAGLSLKNASSTDGVARPCPTIGRDELTNLCDS